MKTCIRNLFLLPALIAGLGLIPAGRVTAQTFTTLHSFAGDSDGANPWAGLILSGNTLYGTAEGGGSLSRGTVFAVNTNGTGFRIVHSFNGSSDGANPHGGLILSGNTLYGTTANGGIDGYGTVFAVNTNGTGFTNLHQFSGGSDGTAPNAGLVLSSNALYGTARFGGNLYNGSVFAVHTDGTGFANLHVFTAPSGPDSTNSDGANPWGGLVLSGNTLYGTAAGGGSLGYGTVFALNTDGTGFTTPHNFNFSDGWSPHAGLILSGNTLYGTAAGGGSLNYGTVFAVHTDGTGVTTLHVFTGEGSDGASPQAGLILSGNTLYGTTMVRGSSGYGTVFAVNTDGTGFMNLHSFTAPDASTGTNSDGAHPLAGLILSGNTLYGTANLGGSSGKGTVFALNAPVLLADNGFRPSANGFGFGNYGDSPPGRTNLTPVEVQRLFGDRVFATVNSTERILTPSAQKWMEATSKEMDGGHCEGMAVLSLFIYSGLLDAAKFGNPSINGLIIDGNPALQREIALWWATQCVDPTRSSAIDATPTNILDLLISSLKRESQETYVLHVFMDGKGGHAVTPYAVADLGNGFAEVRLYDNNHPNIERRLLIDRIKNTWEFNLSTNPNSAESVWSGDATTHSIAVAPSSPRLQTQVCPFCLDTSGAAAVVNEIWVNGNAVKILLTDAQGKRYGYDAGTFYQEIPGVTHRVLASGDELWQDSPSPNYYVPVGMAVTLTLDGSAVTNVTESSVTMIGPGYHLSLEDIHLNPNQKDTIVFSPDGKSLSYKASSNESPTISLGFETVGRDYDFTLKGVDLETNSTLNIQLDRVRNTLSIHTAGNTLAGTYAFIMGRLDNDHAQYFDHDAIELRPNDTATLDYGNWVGNKATMPLLIDRDSNGTVDETVQLTDEDTIAGTAPTLSAQVVAGGTIKVSWPAWAADYILETNSTLSATGWATVPANQLATEGTNIVFTESVSGSTHFYRLRN